MSQFKSSLFRFSPTATAVFALAGGAAAAFWCRCYEASAAREPENREEPRYLLGPALRTCGFIFLAASVKNLELQIATSACVFVNRHINRQEIVFDSR